MSMPKIPNITPDIDLSTCDVRNILLASIGFEELGLAHIINAEAEKIQYALGTLKESKGALCPDIEDLLKLNDSVNTTLKTVLKQTMLLQFKLEDALSIEECEGEKKPGC